VLLLGVSTRLATGCNANSGPSVPIAGTTAKPGVLAPEIRCTAARADDGQSVIRYEIRNVGSETIYIPSGRHMPYVLARDPDTLVIMQGVNRPDPNAIYEMPQIALTRPLAPAGALAGEVALPPKMLRDHFDAHPTPPRLLHGAIQVRCEAGWGTTAITKRDQMSIHDFYTWQSMVGAGPFQVVLP
jgi:hypothetical protein